MQNKACTLVVLKTKTVQRPVQPPLKIQPPQSWKPTVSSPRPGCCFSLSHSSLQFPSELEPCGARRMEVGHCPQWRGAWWLHGSPVAADELGSGRVVVQALPQGEVGPTGLPWRPQGGDGKMVRRQEEGPRRASGHSLSWG